MVFNIVIRLLSRTESDITSDGSLSHLAAVRPVVLEGVFCSSLVKVSHVRSRFSRFV